jgi:transcriptional regulator GlxA family with amidase domain
VTFQFANPANAGLITRFNEVLSEEPLPLKVADSTAARKLLYLMHRELTSNSIGHALRLKLHLGALAAELLDTCDWNSGNEPKDLHHIVGMNTNKMVNEVIIYLHENFQTKVRLEALGKLTNLHPRYVCTLFSQVTGKTITGFLRQVRIDKAKRLLLYTTLSITEIAYEVGFSNSQYFSKIFRNVEGLEPRTFRKTRRTN